MKHWYIIFSILLSAYSCVYPYDLPDLSEGKEYLVVDASIMLGQRATLSLRTINGRGVMPMIENWWVEDDEGTKYMGSPSMEFVDLSKATADKSYRMVIKVDGKTYSSSFEKADNPPLLEKIEFDADEETVRGKISLKENGSGTGFVAISWEEIWKFHTRFVDAYDVDMKEWKVVEREDPNYERYWCWHYARNENEILLDMTSLDGVAKHFPFHSFARTNNRNHGDYTIKVMARSISPAEYRFRKNLNSSSEGYNLFTPNPGEIAGNVRCEEDPSIPVMGYVTLSYASSMEGHLDGKYHITPRVGNLQELKQEDIPYYYMELEYRPVYYRYDGEDIIHLWGPLRCIDCVADGGTLEKPKFRNL